MKPHFSTIVLVTILSSYALPGTAQTSSATDYAADEPQLRVTPAAEQRPPEAAAPQAVAQPGINLGEGAERALNEALLTRDWSAVQSALADYRRTPGADEILVRYAEGALLREQRRYKAAISIYRGLISEHPDLVRIRLDLAIMLFEDKQYVAARDQFQRVRASEAAAPDINLIDAYLDRINQEQGWDFSGGLSYFRDNNLNNASSSETITLGSKVLTKKPESLPQSGQGLRFSADAERDFSLGGSHYANVSASMSGRKIFGKTRFDDYRYRLEGGYRYRDANWDAKFLPFVTTRYYGGDHFSNSIGVNAEAGHWFSPNLRLSAGAEFEHEKNLRDGESSNSISLNSGVLYAPSSTQYWFGGINANRMHAIGSPVGSYNSAGGYLGWGQDWPHGISTRVSGNATHRFYDEESRLFKKVRKDNIYGAQLTIWHRDWHVAGITPKLTFYRNTVDSNIPDLYSYSKGNVFLQFDKTF